MFRFETSAKNNTGIDKGIMVLLKKIMNLGNHSNASENKRATDSSTITIRARPKKIENEATKKTSCCS